ncbi:hypothetical protein KFE25_011220 [Diacronema lutheri]|uniref:High light inducible protein n=2 Tax=Diacronema lutheri TaxID=2081491 RepID=A0A8J6CD66_DIALT|nr:hypothetical protein KFE25_011220 [Diacronema lutheri]
MARRLVIALALLAGAAVPTGALRVVGAPTRARARISRTTCVRMDDAPTREVVFPPEEVEAAYAAEVDAVLAKLGPYVPEDERYLFGFVPWAEKINGRFAMMGFTILLILESVLGKGILQIFN